MRFVDSHLHLEGEEAEGILALAGATQTLLLTCGVDRKTSEIGLEQATANPDLVKAFIGVHPSEALNGEGLEWLESALMRAGGVGEIGLDPKYSAKGPRSAQMRVLLAQLKAAQSARKPVQVHSRNAERECLEALRGFGPGSVLMHWFQAEELLQEVQGRGYFVSFGPSLLYSKKLQRMAARCSHSQVLTESDFPVSFGPLGEVRGPPLVPSVVFKLSEIWGERFEDARATLVENVNRFLGPSEKG